MASTFILEVQWPILAGVVEENSAHQFLHGFHPAVIIIGLDRLIRRKPAHKWILAPKVGVNLKSPLVRGFLLNSFDI